MNNSGARHGPVGLFLEKFNTAPRDLGLNSVMQEKDCQLWHLMCGRNYDQVIVIKYYIVIY